jgi:hypothetical protein
MMAIVIQIFNSGVSVTMSSQFGSISSIFGGAEIDWVLNSSMSCLIRHSEFLNVLSHSSDIEFEKHRVFCIKSLVLSIRQILNTTSKNYGLADTVLQEDANS